MLMTKIAERECAKCSMTKDVSEFYRKGRGYTSYCKVCMRALSHQRVVDGRDRASKLKYEEKQGHARGDLPSRQHLSAIQRMSREIYRNARKRSLYGNIKFDLTSDDVEQMIKVFCENNYHSESTSKNPFKPSLDRIDSSNGYTKSNTKVCWMIENYCKNTFTDDEVIEFCMRKLGLI